MTMIIRMASGFREPHCSVEMDRQANTFSDLFYHCVQVLNEYPGNVSEESFLEDYFLNHQVPNQSFVTTVLIDCNRHEKILQAIVKFFYQTDGKNIRRSEENIYKVIAYLIFFQMESVQNDLLQGFIQSVPLYKMHQFFQYLCNEEHLMAVRNECLKFYDDVYVDEKITRIIRIYLADLRGILLDLTDTVEGRTAPRVIAEPTKTKPFQLTAPKPRAIPIPRIISKMEKSRPPPKTTYEAGREQFEIEKAREINRRQAQQKLNQARSLSFHHLQIEKSSKTQEKQAKLAEEMEKAAQYEAFRANRPPKALANKIPVKFNVATVLKESRLYKKQEEDVYRRLIDFENGGRDAHEFFQWQETMLKQDYEEQIGTIERKRLEGRISFEEAILARQRLAQENRQIAEQIKRETREAIEQHVKEKLREEKRMKQWIEDVASGRDNAKIAQQKVQQYKTEFVKQYKEELKQMMKQALDEAEAEMRQRAELIHQIRAIESVPIDRWKPIDLTSVAGHGVHEEMSIVELRERLEIAKLEREKQRQSRRDQIIKDKQVKEDLITNTVQNIVKYRNELTSQATKKKQRQASAPATHHPQIEQLKQELQSKKAQRQSQRGNATTITRTPSDPFAFRQPISRSCNEWQRFDQVEKSVHKTQKRLAPSLLA